MYLWKGYRYKVKFPNDKNTRNAYEWSCKDENFLKENFFRQEEWFFFLYAPIFKQLLKVTNNKQSFFYHCGG